MPRPPAGREKSWRQCDHSILTGKLDPEVIQAIIDLHCASVCAAPAVGQTMRLAQNDLSARSTTACDSREIDGSARTGQRHSGSLRRRVPGDLKSASPTAEK